MQGRSQNRGAADRLNDYPHLGETAWTKMERHEGNYSMPRWLHISKKTVGASIKAELK